MASDETWLAHTGSVVLERGGNAATPLIEESVVVGTDLAAGQSPQVVIPAGEWQRTIPSSEQALVSCLVSPGFDFADFELESS